MKRKHERVINQFIVQLKSDSDYEMEGYDRDNILVRLGLKNRLMVEFIILVLFICREGFDFSALISSGKSDKVKKRNEQTYHHIYFHNPLEDDYSNIDFSLHKIRNRINIEFDIYWKLVMQYDPMSKTIVIILNNTDMFHNKLFYMNLYPITRK